MRSNNPDNFRPLPADIAPPMRKRRIEIETIPLLQNIFLITHKHFQLPFYQKGKLFPAVGITFLDLSRTRFHDDKKRLHLSLRDIRSQKTKDGSFDSHIQPLSLPLFQEKNSLQFSLFFKEMGKSYSQRRTDLFQRGDGRRGQSPLHLRKKTLCVTGSVSYFFKS